MGETLTLLLLDLPTLALALNPLLLGYRAGPLLAELRNAARLPSTAARQPSLISLPSPAVERPDARPTVGGAANPAAAAVAAEDRADVAAADLDSIAIELQPLSPTSLPDCRPPATPPPLDVLCGSFCAVLAHCGGALRMAVVTQTSLLLLDIVTVPPAMLLLGTGYRLPRTLRKLAGCANAPGRNGRHWATLTRKAQVPAGAGQDRRPRRANWYVMKRAAKVLLDIPLAVLLLVAAACPTRTILVLADARRLFWCRWPLGDEVIFMLPCLFCMEHP